MTTATDVVVACENTLGFTHAPGKPLFRARSIEAGKIKKKIEADSKVTLDDFMLALEYCRRKREPIKSPVALYWRIEDAKAMANETPAPTSDLSASVQAAMAWELAQLEPDEHWIGRLTRAHGKHREMVLHEWRSSGRG